MRRFDTGSADFESAALPLCQLSITVIFASFIKNVKKNLHPISNGMQIFCSLIEDVAIFPFDYAFNGLVDDFDDLVIGGCDDTRRH